MWTEIARAPNLMVAELWKELFDGEGVTAMIAPVGDDWVGVSERQPRSEGSRWISQQASECCVRVPECAQVARSS